MDLNPTNAEGDHSHFHLLQDLERHFPYTLLGSDAWSQVKNIVHLLIPLI
jgi:hypothetical protein